ncbi:hypothetical protein MSAN_01401600 [Mycena sanguinolenta]|uniref:Uncharacterized protein n=1 Tax=Mycena sanguinolenta TaxID=230812 RepID=A0A8H6Y9Y5_9AGAR|nr:hypothetical protein MSAN_01401600 [Mycena sanguinolenta]
MLYLHQYYQPGAQISLNLRSCDGDKTARNVQATVVKAFTPFTMSQVLLLDINPPLPDILPTNTKFILKVYDPRFLQHRQGTKSSAPHPWTLAAETTAARRRQFGANTSTFLPTWWPDDSDTAGWEEYYHGNLEFIFKNELTAYTRLLSLQGQSIPHCYAYGTLVLPSPSKRMVVPRVLLLSYVPGPCLRAVQPSRVTLPVARGLIDTVRAFGLLGVIHDDLRPDNMILSSSDDHSSVFVLDFGNAQIRTDQSDEEWEWTLAENDELKLTEMILDKLGIRHALD